MSEAIIAKKAELVDVVAEKMKAAASIVVVDSRGLTVEQDTVLRRNLRESALSLKLSKTQSCVVQLKKLVLKILDLIRWTICSSIFKRRCYRTCENFERFFLKTLKHLKLKVVQSKALSHLKKRFLHLQLFQTAKDCFLCSFLYFKRQCATLLLQSKRLQTTKKTLLNLKLRNVA